MIFSKEIISLIFERGAFDSRAISLTSSTLFFYSIGLVGTGLREVLSRAFFALQDTKTPTINAVFGMIFNIILTLLLSQFFQLGGVALASSIAATLTTFLLFFSFRKKYGPFGMKKISISFLKILISSLLMIFIVKLSLNHLSTILDKTISFLISVAIGAATYFMIAYIMRIDEITLMVKDILNYTHKIFVRSNSDLDK